jgi:transaldolase
MSDPLLELSQQGVSIWLDDISRERLRSGNLKELVDKKHVVGVTSNPTIFQKALEKGDAYDEQVRDLALGKTDVDQAVRYLMAYDIRWGCDVLRPTYDKTDGLDGRVSIEVDPRLAHDSDRTTAEAKSLWWLVDRRAGEGRRHRPVDDPLRRLVLRVARRQRGRQAAGQDRL